jgi:alpha-D-ribose 1-methylphosphonate 5-triphosphate synthase subunit PhnH
MWLDAGLRASDEAVTWLRFHCGSPIVDEPRAAAFALVSEPSGLPALDRFDLGTADYPDRSTTIVLQLDTLRSGTDLLLTGPGILGRLPLRAAPLPEDIRARLIANRSLFPRGVDLILVAAGEVAGLPRSVRVVSEEH